MTEEEGKEFARQCGASAYIECSALTQKNLKEVFDCVVEQALNFQAREERKRNRSWRKKGASSPVKREQDQWKKLVVKHKTAERWRRFFCLSWCCEQDVIKAVVLCLAEKSSDPQAADDKLRGFASTALINKQVGNINYYCEECVRAHTTHTK